MEACEEPGIEGVVREELLKSITFVGSIVGLASGVFLVYDRLFRNQPLIFLVPHEYKAALRLKNVSQETLIIEEIDIKPPVIALRNPDDLRTVSEDRQAVWYPTMNDHKAMRVFIILGPLGERTFDLKRSAEFENATEDTYISIRCKWRNSRWPLPFYRSRWLKVSVSDIRAMREASLAGKV